MIRGSKSNSWLEKCQSGTMFLIHFVYVCSVLILADKGVSWGMRGM